MFLYPSLLIPQGRHLWNMSVWIFYIALYPLQKLLQPCPQPVIIAQLKETQNLVIWPKACSFTIEKNKVGMKAGTLHKWVEI